jgi:hypothetical protein
MSRLLILVLAMAVMIAFGGRANAGPVSGKLTPAEIERAKNGEVILKNNINDKSESGAGIGYGVFKGKLDTFWAVVFDYPDYKRMFPPTEYAKIVKKDPSGKFWTEFQLKFMAGLYKITYTSWNMPSADKLRLDFGLDQAYPHDNFKDMGGYWLLEKIDEDVYLAEYKVNVQLSLPPGLQTIVQKIVNSLAGKDMPKMFKSLQKEMDARDGKK